MLMGFCSMWAVYLVWQVATIVLASVLLQVYTFFFKIVLRHVFRYAQDCKCIHTVYRYFGTLE